MESVFSNIIKYKPRDYDTAIDQKENRATEVLVAALNLSDMIKEDFLKLLFDKDKDIEFEGVNKYTIETQYYFKHDSGEGFIDIFIQSAEIKEEINIVVEVKVGSKQDQSQIDKYVKWLKEQNKDYRIFHLVVRNAEEFRNGGKYRIIRWQEICERLEKLGQFERSENERSESTDQKIAQNLILYLNEEGIVSMWKPEQLKSFSDGLKAWSALNVFFERLKSIYHEKGYEIDIEIPNSFTKCKNLWPNIRLGKKEWEGYFGDSKVIFVFFTVKDVWREPEQRICSEIKLFHKDCYPDGSWNKIKVNIPKYKAFLDQKYKIEMSDSKWRDVPVDRFDPSKEYGQIIAIYNHSIYVKDFTSKMEADELVGNVQKNVDEISKDIDEMLGEQNIVSN